MNAFQLSAQQQAAVEHTGSPALVVAGAGAGKTRTLTAKFAHLVDQGVAPERILAITFTNKAADEMKSRLLRTTGLTIDRFPWVRTYHSACLMILKAHCTAVGLAAPVQVAADYQQQKTLTDIVVGRMNLEKKYVSAVRSAISHAKNSGDPMGYLDRHPFAGPVRLADAYNSYCNTMREQNAVDFDDILLLTRDILRDDPAVGDRYRQRFDYLLVDEYQDTNDLQEELTRLLVRDGRLFCVGDDWQAIYSFRGSNVDHFLSFTERFPDARVFRLEQNYRSADEIVSLANRLIGNNDRRMDKECFSEKRGGVVECHGFGDDREEAMWVGYKIRTLRDMGLAWHQMAVLYRTKFSSLAFEQTFRSMGIPYQMLGGKGFFERKEIVDLTCYLAAAAFPKDDASFERILNTPKRGIGPGTIRKLHGMRRDGMTLQDAVDHALSQRLLGPKIYNGLTSVVGLLEAIRELRPDEALRRVVDETDYMEYLRGYLRGGDMELITREENIDQLIYSAGQKDSIVDFLEEAALIREDKSDDDEDSQRLGVNLSTIHAAKGLEFTAVFVVACEEQLFPHWRSAETEAGLEEERRLMYVSLTRAERYLYVTSADYRKGQYNLPSRFLAEIETDDFL